MTIQQLRGLELGMVHVKLEALARHRFSLCGNLHFQKTKSPARLFARRANFFRRMARSLAWRPSLLASTYNSPAWLNSFTSTDSRTFCHGRSSHFFSYSRTLLRGVPTK